MLVIFVDRFVYPSIIIIFEVIDCIVIGKKIYYDLLLILKHFLISTAGLGVIIFNDRNSLLCSSTSLIDSINNPTLFCTISGYYCFICHTVCTILIAY